ncbi:MAG: hypothetical protein L0215_22940 [Gemmataceae bacterium]|nr:hypothetical protein [Gemmataceae bacterium]
MSERFLLGTRKGLFFAEESGGEYRLGDPHFFGDNVSIVLSDRRDGKLYAALDLGHFGVKLQRSDDGGKSWQEIGVPAYPPQPEVQEDKDMWGKPLPWKLIRIWSLAAGGPDQPGLIWCGTLPGGLFRSNDHGQTWELVEALWYEPKRKEWFGGGADYPGIHSICVDPRNSRRVALGISCGGVWITEDGGQTWNCQADGMRAAYMPPEKQFDPNIQDPHAMVQCPARPDVYWVQHHNGIFRTTDGAKFWHEIKDVQPSTFGFGVAVHPKDADTAWFVPAKSDERRIPVEGKVVVTRTRDGGKSFQTLTKGLPQNHAYDLVFRHCLDVDATGNRLAFGSSTGSCWFSNDQGDSWKCLSTNLPPIYCVRFA